jgi:L-rhamnose mutarotase
MKTYCLTLDVCDGPGLMEQYKWYHLPENFWPEVTQVIFSQGILREEIYLAGSRMVMILQTTDDFSLEEKAAADLANPIMRQWETLMWKFQKPLTEARPGEKWVVMEKIFELSKPTV